MSGRPKRLGAVATLAGLTLLSGCTFALWDRPPPERPVDSSDSVRSEERGLITGLFGLTPRDLPSAVEVSNVRTAVVERALGGVILRVTAVAPTQGFFDPALIAASGEAVDASGVVTVRLVAVPPQTPQAVGPERTRLLMAAAFLPDLELRNVRGFRLVAGANVLTFPVPPAPPPPPQTEAF